MEHRETASVHFEVPVDAMRVVSPTAEEFAGAVRLAAAMFWYGRAEISFSTAAELAGCSQVEWMHVLKALRQDTVVLDLEDFDRELVYLAKRRGHDDAHG